MIWIGLKNGSKRTEWNLPWTSVSKINFRGSDRSFNILDRKLDHSKAAEDLCIQVSDNLAWEIQIEERLRKATKVIYFPRRNVAVKVQTLIKLGLYKSLILPVLLYGFACVFASRADLYLLENFQKVVRWITGNEVMSYRSQLKILNILPLPTFLQLNDMLLVSKITHEEMGTSISLPERPEKEEEVKSSNFGRHEEKGRSEFVSRNCRLVNRLDNYMDFMNPQGLKNRLLRLM